MTELTTPVATPGVDLSMVFRVRIRIRIRVRVRVRVRG